MSTTTTNPSQDPAQVPESLRLPLTEEQRRAVLQVERERDQARMERAPMDLDAVIQPELGPQVWLVTGGSEPHFVNLDPAMPLCDCGDHLQRNRICAHAICARLWSGENILLILRDLRAGRERRLEDSERFRAAQAGQVAA